jgi:molybdopterin converting factor subunit 1
MNLRIQYFALLREQAGRSEEMIESACATPAELYGELKSRHGFTLALEQLKVAINSEFSEWSKPLKAGDAVVFIPPVAGG